ncbi:class I SAM-dependent methyltransferase (plasmid) [Cytobacillus firmus]|jgi:ubiquinone/menaquinone biosynthesis C-methylase UbiE|uniref:Class I SAM-dependent methyltransferase n=2 Tax=Cytobacillus TaxID=2675230 RepID=A0AA46P614_CYTFI|nr:MULTISPECIES: class I SAM-dependent methyltransferase [Cytobacillus]AND42979.1 methyltransferase type 11 [Cytobacillus oceanisediminis 2691]MCM3244646.1 class I SAM-dependent methyltransferase [Cytobacillus oceanisediminis]USK41772.1 class I SAM-dependent methyltransferase [Cytobacillus firmus]USK47499.1 class I SAM-dependent methyltransferase [Cytobacillus oceanisediminis]UYG98372.1 class I SAM-dependent methyltransferase [Cytobacillus firmus]
MDKNKKGEYIPALKYHWMTRFYDPLIQWGMQEKKFKTHLVKQATLQPNETIMDLACGTGTLALLIQQSQPGVQVIGVDADPKILSIAKGKIKETQVNNITFEEGFSDKLPFSNNLFHHIFTSLFIHHLTQEMKKKTFEEVYRTLRSGGQFHIIDFEKPQNWLMRVAFFSIQFLDGFETTSNHVKGIIPNLLKETGFVSIEETGQFSTITGTLRAYKAFKP